MPLLRRRTMMEQTGGDDDMAREWTTLVDEVIEEEIMNPSYDVDANCNYREFAVYVLYNANEAGSGSGYVRVDLTDINGIAAGAQSMAGIPASGYYRATIHVTLGSSVNLFDIKSSNNTSFTPVAMYGSIDTVLDAVKKISIISYANIGAGSKIKIMAR